MFRCCSLRDFLDGPVVETLPSNEEGVGSIFCQGVKVIHASWPKNKTQNRSSIVTNSTKTLQDGPHQKRLYYFCKLVMLRRILLSSWGPLWTSHCGGERVLSPHLPFIVFCQLASVSDPAATKAGRCKSRDQSGSFHSNDACLNGFAHWIWQMFTTDAFSHASRTGACGWCSHELFCRLH